jgi:threonine synthase
VVVCTVTGHGLKDPQWALKNADGEEVRPVRVPVDAMTAAAALGLAEGVGTVGATGGPYL